MSDWPSPALAVSAGLGMNAAGRSYNHANTAIGCAYNLLSQWPGAEILTAERAPVDEASHPK